MVNEQKRTDALKAGMGQGLFDPVSDVDTLGVDDAGEFGCSALRLKPRYISKVKRKTYGTMKTGTLGFLPQSLWRF